VTTPDVLEITMFINAHTHMYTVTSKHSCLFNTCTSYWSGK